MIAGGQIVGINCANDEPDIVSAAWLADRLTLSKSTRLSIDIYMDSEREVKIYEWLKTQGGDKQTILAALEKLMENA